MKYLIVTADDLGLAKSINDGIADACKDGIVTAVSVIPTGEAIDDAINVARDLPFKDIGAHLALSETRPLLKTSKFYKNHKRLFLDLSLGRVDLNDIYSELKAQMDVLKRSGLKITHINSHEHIHMMPKMLDVFIRLAKEYDVPAIRFPSQDRPARLLSIAENYRKIILDQFASRMEKRLTGSGLVHTDCFFGLLDSGRLDIGKIKNILKMLGEGVTELVTHPGFLGPEVLNRYSWHIGGETELFALTDKSIKNAIADNGIKLLTFEQFLSLKR